MVRKKKTLFDNIPINESGSPFIQIENDNEDKKNAPSDPPAETPKESENNDEPKESESDKGSVENVKLDESNDKPQTPSSNQGSVEKEQPPSSPVSEIIETVKQVHEDRQSPIQLFMKNENLDEKKYVNYYLRKSTIERIDALAGKGAGKTGYNKSELVDLLLEMALDNLVLKDLKELQNNR